MMKNEPKKMKRTKYMDHNRWLSRCGEKYGDVWGAKNNTSNVDTSTVVLITDSAKSTNLEWRHIPY